MKKNVIALICLVICLYLCGCGSPDRGQNAMAQDILQVSQDTKVVMQENRDSADKDLEVIDKSQEYLSDIEGDKAERAKKEIEDIRSMAKDKLEYERCLSDEREEVYKDENGDLYCYNNAGEMIDFTANMENMNCRAAKAREEDVKEAADIYLQNLVEMPSYYQLNHIEYNEYVNLNLAIYNHKINGLDTTDLVLVILDNELNLTSFSIPRAHAFQELEEIEVDVEKIKQEALDIYYQMYGDSVEDVKVENFQIGTDDDENMGYQVGICGRGMSDVEGFDIPETIFIPYHKDN